jgi:RHS repeat-associated protein
VIKEINVTTGDITGYLYGDDLIKQTRAANDSYYLYDGLGSTRALSNNIGLISDTYDYSSFGRTLNQTGATENNYLFTGEQYDSNLDNYYLRARYYDQNIGRFTQQDTWKGNDDDPITLHKYLYANVNPVSMIDPSGRMTLIQFSIGMATLGTLANIANPSISLATWDSDKNYYAQNHITQGLLMLASRSKWGALMSVNSGGDTPAHPEEDDAIKTSENGGTCEEIKYAITILVQSITHRMKWINRDAGHEERIRVLDNALRKLKGMYGFTCGFLEGEEPVEDFIDKIPPG